MNHPFLVEAASKLSKLLYKPLSLIEAVTSCTFIGNKNVNQIRRNVLSTKDYHEQIHIHMLLNRRLKLHHSNVPLTKNPHHALPLPSLLVSF